MKRVLCTCLVAGLCSTALASTDPPDEAGPPPEPAQRIGARPASSPPPAAAPAPAPQGRMGKEQAGRRKNSAAEVARDGTFLPQTVSARIGDQYVSGMALGGYDGAQGQGGRFTGVVEGALFNRIALRVATDYASGAATPQFSAGLRLGVLRQEQHHIDLGFVAQYNNHGFTEVNGEIELMIAVARRWNRFGLYGNLVYGQGFEQRERDGEVRLAFLYAVHDRVNVGLDARGRFDLGSGGGQPMAAGESPFDLIAGPVASVAIGPVAFLAQVGVHTMMLEGPSGQDLGFSTGAVAMGGIGAAY